MNIGKFIRKFSTDTESESSKGGLISGTSKLFDSVNTKTTNLVSGISSTFENIKRRTSIETLSFTDKESTKLEDGTGISCGNVDGKPFEPSSVDSSSKPIVENFPNQNIETERKPPPPKPPIHPPQPKRAIDEFQSQIEAVYRKDNPPMSVSNISDQSFDSEDRRRERPPKPPPPLTKQKSAPHDDDRPFDRDVFNRSQTIADHEIMEDFYQNEFMREGDLLANQVLANAKIELEKLTQLECQKIVSAMDDLISFDQPTMHLTPGNDDNSSPSEYGGDAGDKPIYGDVLAKTNRESDGSVESEPEELNSDQKNFMEVFLNILYKEGVQEINEAALNRFKKMIQSRSSRSWITKLMEKHHYINSKQVSESVFYRLIHIFTLILLECNECEDFLPARNLMLLAFGCHTTLLVGGNQSRHNLYLSSFISCHPIWKSIQFWSFCFFNAVQEVRSKRANIRRNSNNTTDADGVAFHQLQVHLNYMRGFGIPINLCSEFVRKQVNIVDLTEEEMVRLKELMDSWKD